MSDDSEQLKTEDDFSKLVEKMEYWNGSRSARNSKPLMPFDEDTKESGYREGDLIEVTKYIEELKTQKGEDKERGITESYITEITEPTVFGVDLRDLPKELKAAVYLEQLDRLIRMDLISSEERNQLARTNEDYLATIEKFAESTVSQPKRVDITKQFAITITDNSRKVIMNGTELKGVESLHIRSDDTGYTNVVMQFKAEGLTKVVGAAIVRCSGSSNDSLLGALMREAFAKCDMEGLVSEDEVVQLGKEVITLLADKYITEEI